MLFLFLFLVPQIPLTKKASQLSVGLQFPASLFWNTGQLQPGNSIFSSPLRVGDSPKDQDTSWLCLQRDPCSPSAPNAAKLRARAAPRVPQPPARGSFQEVAILDSFTCIHRERRAGSFEADCGRITGGSPRLLLAGSLQPWPLRT